MLTSMDYLQIARRHRFRGLWLSGVLVTAAVVSLTPLHGETPRPDTSTKFVRLPPVSEPRVAQRAAPMSQLNAILKRLLPEGSLPQIDGESVPPPPPNAETSRQFTLPLAPLAGDPQLQLQPSTAKELVTLTARNTPLNIVLEAIAQQHGLNIVMSEQVGIPISVNLADVPLEDALYSILTVNGFTWHKHRNILAITPIVGATQLSPLVQGRELRVFSLNFSSAAEIDRVVKGLLSPVGQSFIAETDSADKRKTREQLIVEDLPEYLERIESLVAQSDAPPRQVLVEAHILQVDLSGKLTHGVNFEQLSRIANGEVTLETVGLADATASPAFFLRVNGTDLTALVEALKTTTDAKTLASPKVMVLNGQEARIQIGEQLGFFVTTTTQTSTLQDVQFLDVGVVLSVTPLISDDGRVIMSVKPEVSGGRINPATSLPEEETTEVETTVMLRDGQGMIIGGLIKETDTEIASKIPWLGDLAFVGRAFQRRIVDKQRNEVIIVLVPHIVPLDPAFDVGELVDLERTMTPLLDGPLHRVDRRMWEPTFPAAVHPALGFTRLPPPQAPHIPYGIGPPADSSDQFFDEGPSHPTDTEYTFPGLEPTPPAPSVPIEEHR